MGYFMMKIHWIRLHYINILIHIGKDKCIQSPYIIISIPYHIALWNGSLVRIQFDDFYFSFMHIFLAFLCHSDGISMEFYCYILFAPFFTLLSHKGLYISTIMMPPSHISILLWQSRMTQQLRHIHKITLTAASAENPWFKWQWNSKETRIQPYKKWCVLNIMVCQNKAKKFDFNFDFSSITFYLFAWMRKN